MQHLIELTIQHFPLLLDGLWVTLYLTVLSIMLGLTLGVLLALGKIYGPGYISWFCKAFIAIIRGTPLMVQLFILYFGLPPYGIKMSALTVAVIGFTINSGAYQAEYLRGSIESIDINQLQAAYSLGMSKWQAIFYIILPQALRRVIPAWTNEFIYLLKYTSLAYVIGAPELMGQAKFVASRNFEYFNMYLIVAAIYFVIVIVMTEFLKWVERRVKIPGYDI
ncbi:MAG: amino acid ABC transporter permease [Bacillota bacterium]